MSNTHDPDFITHIQNEYNYSEAFMADTHNLQRTLFTEMINRIPDNISTPPEVWGPCFKRMYLKVLQIQLKCVHFLGGMYSHLVLPPSPKVEIEKSLILTFGSQRLYYQYIPVKKEYPVLCRKRICLIPKVKVKLSNDRPLCSGYVHVGTCRISPDHRFLAYTIDVSGDERFLLQVKNLERGTIIPTLRIEDVVSLAWAQDSCTLFYTVYVIDANNPKDGLRKIHDRVSGVQFFLEHHKGFFYILTNAPLASENELLDRKYYLARCCVDDVQSTSWQVIFLLIFSEGGTMGGS
ncbi:uncharacterized protein [Rutidosis leptorrhynchoides]|uniref:uncharacterized protein n=1 Tax=Rutidosis leptorrhynchoides TaxID=125765 RepID=UPI003A98FC7A